MAGTEMPFKVENGKMTLGDGMDVGKVGLLDLALSLTQGTVWEKEVGVLLGISSPSDVLAIIRGNKAPLTLVIFSSIIVSLVLAVYMTSGKSSRGQDKGGARVGNRPPGVGGGNSREEVGMQGEGEETAEEDPPRDFSIEQLREFDGENGKPLYVSLRGEVYDVSSARDFYGKGNAYHCFVGREASRAMAKLSFDEEVLSNTRLDDLNAMELDVLDNWIEKFKHFKCYPVRGRCSEPPKNLSITLAEISAFKGNSTTAKVPEGRIDAPIYLGINGKVLDVSYGGKENYGPDGPYCVLTGIDASRALAKMSFDAQDLQSQDLSDLTDNQKEALAQWDARLCKKYPVVGKLC